MRQPSAHDIFFWSLRSSFSSISRSGFCSTGTTLPPLEARISSAKREAESSAHRGARRKRTRSRTLLRNVVSGTAHYHPQEVAAACATLRCHHSQSHLPQAVMSGWGQASVSPWCAYCKRWAKKGATICQGCGWEVSLDGDPGQQPLTPRGRLRYVQQDDYGQWDARGRQRWPSEDSQRRRPSRKRSGDQDPAANKGKGKGKDKGKDKGKEVPFALAQLPIPPQAQIMVPARGAPPASAASSGGTDEQRLLYSLISALAKADSLPEDVRKLASQAQTNQAQQEGKALHKFVKMRTDARRNLQQLDK